MQRPGIIEALADVRELRKRILEQQLFSGYSGWARISGGCFALLGALVFSRSWFPAIAYAHVVGWGCICALSLTVNFRALLCWWKSRAMAVENLRPVLDLLAPFLVGGLLTFLVLANGAYQLLFPIWMWIFGLMNIASKHSMPRTMVYLGWYYILMGTICALNFDRDLFFNPWPMGIVFFIGELVGGIAFIRLRKEQHA